MTDIIYNGKPMVKMEVNDTEEFTWFRFTSKDGKHYDTNSFRGEV